MSNGQEGTARDRSSDPDLIDAYLSGDEEAFRVLHERHHENLLDFATKEMGDRARAKELVQDGWSQIYRHLHRFDPEIASFSTWAQVIVKRLVRSQHKRDSRCPVILFERLASNTEVEDTRVRQFGDASRAPDRLTRRRRLRRRLQEALDQLRPVFQRVLHLYHFRGRSYAEIAEELEVPIGTVKSHLHRARRALREQMKEERPQAA